MIRRLIARPRLIEEIQRLVDLQQETFNLLPFVRAWTFRQPLKQLLFSNEELGECRHGKNSNPSHRRTFRYRARLAEKVAQSPRA